MPAPNAPIASSRWCTANRLPSAVFRTPPSGLLGHLVPDSESSGIDPIELLRWMHLNLPYRQRRQEEVRVRNYRVQLSDLVPAEADG